MDDKKKGYYFFPFIIVAAYFIVKAFNILPISQAILDQEKWIGFVAALLLLWGGYKVYQGKSSSY